LEREYKAAEKLADVEKRERQLVAELAGVTSAGKPTAALSSGK